MDARVEGRIRAARSEIAASATLPVDRKDSLQLMLDHAEACSNGDPDKIEAIAAGMADMIVHVVRNETREGERVQAAIDAHRTECRVARVPRTLREALLSVATQYPLLAAFLLMWLAKEGLLLRFVEMFK